jgi:proteasome lid subunit RPN8/RPN11
MTEGYRTKRLPRAKARGRLVVAEWVLAETRAALRAAGSPNPPHEGLVFWLGRECETDTLVMSCCRPRCESGPRFVRADEASVGEVARLARALRLGIVAQVHSHPGRGTEHSDGDDDLVLMPFDGMYSLVVASYGSGGMLPSEGAGLHQRQDGRWVFVEQVDPALIVVPAATEPT